MADSKISILIQAKDNATPTLATVDKSLQTLMSSVAATSRTTASATQTLRDNWQSYAAIAYGAGQATQSLAGFMSSSVDAANKYQAAVMGLSSVAQAFSVDQGKAQKAAEELAGDGLLPVTDAARGLKNLLASGFSLDQAVTLMKRFKDSAAFGRQASLSFGDAIASATEGIKNGNSILVDNAGVTKNLSVMLTEAGFSANDLMNATSDANVRQAIFNGILKETNPQLGDAAKLAESAAGKQAEYAKRTQELQEKIGVALQPALLKLLETITPMIEKLAGWIEKNPELASGILITAVAVTGITAALGALALAIPGAQMLIAGFGAAGVLAVGGVSTAFSGLAALVATPIVMPALAIGAALISIAAVLNAYNDMRNAINEAEIAQSNKASSDTIALQRAKEQYQSGKISKERYNAIIANANGRASGGPVTSGTPYIVGERGPEMFVPNSGGRVANASETAKMSGQTTNIYGNITLGDATAVDRFFARLDRQGQLLSKGLAA